MKPVNTELEKCRVKRGPMASDASYGNNGAFLVRCPGTRRRLLIIISDEDGWEHASVSIPHKPNVTPSWQEMCFVKSLFWLPEECVIQYHPPQSEHVNFAEALHLWRPVEQVVPMPPIEMV